MIVINIPKYSIIIAKRRGKISKNNENINDNDYLTNNVGFYNNTTNTFQE